MVVIVLGMHKSGITLVSKTLHEAGIDMHPDAEGNYKESKYEDPEAKRITHEILGNPANRHSLTIPSGALRDDSEIHSKIAELIAEREGNWGFKFPDATLAYPVWKRWLPKHIAVGVRRSLDGVIGHYMKNQGLWGAAVQRVMKVWNKYNEALASYDIPIVSFDRLIEHGPADLENIIGMPLPDVREGKQNRSDT